MSYRSSRSVDSDKNAIKWADDYVKESSPEADSISSDSSDCGSEKEGPSRTLRSKSIFHNWKPELIWAGLQALPGVENDFVEAIKEDNLNAVLQNPFALTTGLLIATYLGKATIVKSLLNLGASVEQIDMDGRTALHIAANCDNFECLKALVDHKSDVNRLDAKQKVSPLHIAASKGSLTCLKYLLKSGADINLGLMGKKTPLHYAVENSEVECVKLLLDMGAQPNTIQVFSETPLHVAATMGCPKIIKLLLQHGASVNVQSGTDKSTPLHLAAEDGNIECVRLLIDAHANISAVNHRKQTPLHIAAFCQASEPVELLLKTHANPNASDQDGRTPLHNAIVKVSRSSECVKLLLAGGANVNKADAFGYTPLHLAALNEFSTCVMMLINAGGDVTARTNGGISVLTFITRRTPDVIPKYIEKFDNAIKLTDHEIGDVDCELKLDFRILVPTPTKGETELLLNFIEVGHRDILKHPLCETFLYLKWRRIRKYFLFSLFYHAVYVLLFTIYIVGVFLKDCESKIKFTMFRVTPTPNRTDCVAPQWAKLIGYAMITLNLCLVSKEIFQIAHSWLSYIKQWENWLQWLIIIAIFLCVVPTSDDITITMYSWQHHVAAIGIFLTWLELMMIVGRFPIFGLYIQMFTTVAMNFSKFLLAYVCLLIAFGLSFGVLFANYPPFNNIFLSIMKTIIMMSGELEYEDMFYTKEHPIQYSGTAHVMYLAFVLLVTVILTNLMVGLAVSDIQGLQQSAGLDRLVRQAELVAHLESMLFSRLLRWIPAKFLAFFYKHALLLQSHHHSALYLRPNDPRENRIPKDLVKSVYGLVAERKERFRRKRSAKAHENHQLSRLHSTSDYTYMGKSNKLNVEYNNIHCFA